MTHGRHQQPDPVGGTVALAITAALVVVLIVLAHSCARAERPTFYYLMTFNKNNLADPLGIFGPYSRSECMQIVKLSSGVWCQAIVVRK